MYSSQSHVPLSLSANPNECLVSSKSSTDARRVVATIDIVGHASPRWDGARDSADADRKNAELAEQRAQAVKAMTERHLRELLPSNRLAFNVDMNIVNPLAGENDVNMGTRSNGSRDTLREAGSRGRTANDPNMRRADIAVRLDFAVDTTVEETRHVIERMRGDSWAWKMRILGSGGVEAGVTVSGGGLVLHNKRLNRAAVYSFATIGLGPSVGISIVETDLQWSHFSTPKRMSFSDFDGATFLGISVSANVGIGGEFSGLKFTEFRRGHPVPGIINTSTWKAGGVQIGAQGFTGTLQQLTQPDETYALPVPTVHRETFQSTAREDRTHRVLFATGSSAISREEDSKLGAFLATVAQPFRG